MLQCLFKSITGDESNLGMEGAMRDIEGEALILSNGRQEWAEAESEIKIVTVTRLINHGFIMRLSVSVTKLFAFRKYVTINNAFASYSDVLI